MSESVKGFMDRIRAKRRPHHPEEYIAELERELEERLRVNMALIFDSDGEPRDLVVCACGVVATGYAQARCGRDGRTNIRATCPTCEVAVVLPVPPLAGGGGEKAQ
jgi:hypothetical protein